MRQGQATRKVRVEGLDVVQTRTARRRVAHMGYPDVAQQLLGSLGIRENFPDHARALDGLEGDLLPVLAGGGRRETTTSLRVSQLKARTRCAKSGQVGHWMKECRGVPDQRFLSRAGAQAKQQIRSKENLVSGEITTVGDSVDPTSPQTTTLDGFFFAGTTGGE